MLLAIFVLLVLPESRSWLSRHQLKCSVNASANSSNVNDGGEAVGAAEESQSLIYPPSAASTIDNTKGTFMVV